MDVEVRLLRLLRLTHCGNAKHDPCAMACLSDVCCSLGRSVLRCGPSFQFTASFYSRRLHDCDTHMMGYYYDWRPIQIA